MAGMANADRSSSPAARRRGAPTHTCGWWATWCSCRGPAPGDPTARSTGATVGADGEVTLDIRVQTRAVLDNIAALLAEVGLSLADLVDVTSFLVTMDDFDGYNEVYGEYFAAEPDRRARPSPSPPCRTRTWRSRSRPSPSGGEP